MSANVLAVDLGSTGIKVAVVDELGAVRSIIGEVIPLLFVADGGVEQDPRVWWEALGRCSRRAIAESGLAGSGITLVAVTSQYTSTKCIASSHRAAATSVVAFRFIVRDIRKKKGSAKCPTARAMVTSFHPPASRTR